MPFIFPLFAQRSLKSRIWLVAVHTRIWLIAVLVPVNGPDVRGPQMALVQGVVRLQLRETGSGQMPFPYCTHCWKIVQANLLYCMRSLDNILIHFVCENLKCIPKILCLVLKTKTSRDSIQEDSKHTWAEINQKTKYRYARRCKTKKENSKVHVNSYYSSVLHHTSNLVVGTGKLHHQTGDRNGASVKRLPAVHQNLSPLPQFV